MIGILLQDEKFPGVHLAFGDPYGSQTHADWKSRTHVDVLTRDCNVWIDDEQVIAEGRYLLDRFDLRERRLRLRIRTVAFVLTVLARWSAGAARSAGRGHVLRTVDWKEFSSTSEGDG